MVHTDQQGMCRGQWVGAARGTVLGRLTIPRSVGRAGSSMAAAVTWDPPTASRNWQATASTRRQLTSNFFSAPWCHQNSASTPHRRDQ